jgi:hypothetical protein
MVALAVPVILATSVMDVSIKPLVAKRSVAAFSISFFFDMVSGCAFELKSASGD